MSIAISQDQSVVPDIRRFGVTDYEAYWIHRKKIGTTRQTRLHGFLASLVGRLVHPGSRVLDCGVGPGHAYRLIAENNEAYGVEISDEAIALYDFDTSRIAQADLNNGIPDFGGKFDVIITSMIIHHLDNPAEFLQQVMKQLAPGGYFVPVIPNICYWPYRFGYFFLGKFPPISHAHKNFQTAAEFEKLVEDAGFSKRRLLTPKKSWRAKLLPTWFSQDLIYVLQSEPQSESIRSRAAA